MCLARPKAVSQAKPNLFGPGQARSLVTAQQRLWPGSEELKAKAAAQAAALVVLIQLLKYV
jgi:hypothetical protein